jgi:hypothetical protein
LADFIPALQREFTSCLIVSIENDMIRDIRYGGDHDQELPITEGNDIDSRHLRPRLLAKEQAAVKRSLEQAAA